MAQDDGERLGRGNLSLKDVVAQSVGYLGPVFFATFFIPTIIGFSVTGRGAGIASPLAILLTAIGMLGLAWIISRYAKRIHAAGALSTTSPRASAARRDCLRGGCTPAGR